MNIKAPLFFRGVFNREDGGYNTYAIVLDDNNERYTLTENNIKLLTFDNFCGAIDYFQDEFNVEYTK